MSKIIPPVWKDSIIWTGENLQLMKGMETGSVDLIATDPPFNKGRNFRHFKDTWSWRDVSSEFNLLPKYNNQLNKLIDISSESHSESMSAYIVFMANRLLEMHRLLKPTGSIYIHCDTTSSHYIKILMDIVFGIDNFRNEIVWRIGWVSGFKTQRKGFIRNHDIILYYVKSKQAIDLFNKQYRDYKQRYINGTVPHGGKGVPLEDTWNCSNEDRLDSIMIKSFVKATGYPTEKPVALMERIIRSSTKEGDFVLDPFCGSGTTLVAAERLNRRWSGIDISEKATEITEKRMKEEGVAYCAMLE